MRAEQGRARRRLAHRSRSHHQSLGAIRREMKRRRHPALRLALRVHQNRLFPRRFLHMHGGSIPPGSTLRPGVAEQGFQRGVSTYRFPPQTTGRLRLRSRAPANMTLPTIRHPSGYSRMAGRGALPTVWKRHSTAP